MEEMLPPLITRKTSKKKRALSGKLQGGKYLLFYFPTKSPLENNKLQTTTFLNLIKNSVKPLSQYVSTPGS